MSRITQYIQDTFQQQVISYGTCVEWLARSPDLNPSTGPFHAGIHQTKRLWNSSINSARTSKPYYGCLCQRVKCREEKWAAENTKPSSGVYCY
ncbi:uncharacterized protein TNCV_998991 [Trichonephila clavipes]|nr:uncharacterized protein TNCV_998991 [Trichonephila clavipes]